MRALRTDSLSLVLILCLVLECAGIHAFTVVFALLPVVLGLVVIGLVLRWFGHVLAGLTFPIGTKENDDE